MVWDGVAFGCGVVVVVSGCCEFGLVLFIVAILAAGYYVYVC